MANKQGVGNPRERNGVKYYPIYYFFDKKKAINTSVKAISEFDASRKLKERIAKFHSTAQTTGDIASSLEKAREELKQSLSKLSNEKDKKYLWKNTFTRLFIDFPKAYNLNISSCFELPKGFFKKYEYYFCEILKRSSGWRAEIIRLKAMIKRLYTLGYCSENDLKQVREEHTPEGIPIPPPKVSDKQLEMLLEYAKNDRPDIYKPTEFMHLIGRRPKETCDIMKEDVSMNGLNPLSIQTKPKSAKIKFVLPKKIYLDDPELNTLIRSALANNKTKWLFPHKDGGKMKPDYLWKYLSKISEKIIGIRITAKSFRKLFLTKANIDALSPISMQLANISSVSVMMKNYVGTSQEAQAKLLAKMRGKDV